MVNELKTHMKIIHSDFFLMYMLKKKIEIHFKMIMIWIYENMAHFKPFKSP